MNNNAKHSHDVSAREERRGWFGAAKEAFARLFGLARDDTKQASNAMGRSTATNATMNTPLLWNLQPNVLSRALDALHTPVVILAARMIVAHANEEARVLFGEQIVGRNFGLFFRDSDTLMAIENTFDDGIDRQIDINVEVPMKRQYRLRISKFDPRPHESDLAVLEFQETTLIRRSETMRSDFVANVSHELRSPLATLIGFIETLRHEDGSDTQMSERFLKIMEGEAQRMRRLIDDLLSLTNVELREHERPRDRVNLAEILREVSDSLLPRAHAQNLEIHLACRDDMPDACGDRDQLIQVFHNLLTNAIKYGSDGQKVDIVVELRKGGLPDEEASIDVRVHDYGPGIAREHLPRLTERFYRVDKGRSRIIGGTGLGLAIVKHIVNRHRGRFFVESEVGKGSTFNVRLPMFREGTQDRDNMDTIYLS